jgi:hypothetical protein
MVDFPMKVFVKFRWIYNKWYLDSHHAGGRAWSWRTVSHFSHNTSVADFQHTQKIITKHFWLYGHVQHRHDRRHCQAYETSIVIIMARMLASTTCTRSSSNEMCHQWCRFGLWPLWPSKVGQIKNPTWVIYPYMYDPAISSGVTALFCVFGFGPLVAKPRIRLDRNLVSYSYLVVHMYNVLDQ